MRDVAVLEIELRPAPDDAAHIEAHFLRPFLPLLLGTVFGSQVNQVLGAADKVVERSKRRVQNRLGVSRIEVGHIGQPLLDKLILIQRWSAIHHCLNLCHLLIALQIRLLEAEPKASSSANVLDALSKEFTPVIYDGRIIRLKGICEISHNYARLTHLGGPATFNPLPVSPQATTTSSVLMPSCSAIFLAVRRSLVAPTTPLMRKARNPTVGGLPSCPVRLFGSSTTILGPALPISAVLAEISLSAKTSFASEPSLHP